MQIPFISRIMDYTHYLMFSFLPSSGTVVDCTCGNGHDFLFLVKNGSEHINYFAFDIQAKAIENTKMRVQDFCEKRNINVIKSSHTEIDSYFKTNEVDMFVYNLGWLPGENSDRNITTNYKDTIESVKKAMDLIKLRGVIIITSYRGHDEGKVEYTNLKQFLKTADNLMFRVLRMEYDNSPNNPPSIFVIQKVKCD